MGAIGGAGRLDKSRMKKPGTIMTTELLGMSEAGRRAGCSATTMQRRLAVAEVPMTRINGWTWAVLAADLEDYLKAGPPRRRGRPRKAQAQGAAFATT
jgi:hypothetical protein